MAAIGFIESELKGLPTELRGPLLRIFRELLTNLRFGHPSGDTADALENFGGAFLSTTTPSTPNELFTIEHGLGRAPYLLIPCAALDQEGQQVVPLVVERVADDRRVYLSSSVASAAITVVVEG